MIHETHYWLCPVVTNNPEPTRLLLAKPNERRFKPTGSWSCKDHKDWGHTIEECRHLHYQVERPIHTGLLHEYGVNPSMLVVDTDATASADSSN